MCVGLRDIQYLSPGKTKKKKKKVDTARPTPRRVYRNYDVSQSLLGDGVLESSLKKFGRAPAEQTSRRGRRTNKSLSLPSKKATTEELFIAFKKSHGSSLLHLPSFSFLDTKKKKRKRKRKTIPKYETRWMAAIAGSCRYCRSGANSATHPARPLFSRCYFDIIY